MLESHPEETSVRQLDAAYLHGKTRRTHQYSSDMLVEEARVLESCIFEAVQNNLLRLNMSKLIPDLVHVTDSSQLQMRETIRGFEGKPRATGALTHAPSAEQKSEPEDLRNAKQKRRHR